MALKDLGLPETAPAQVARVICDSPYYNPREYDYAELRGLIDQSLLGTSTNLILLRNSMIDKKPKPLRLRFFICRDGLRFIQA